MNPTVSVLIPSRNEPFLFKTVCDLLQKAEGDVELLIVLDGYWTEPVADPRVHYIHRGEPLGMRAAINAAAALAKGDYLLKCDAHTMWDQGFDVKLAADCEENWVVIPRRKRLDADNWSIQDVGKPDVDYEYLSCPSDPNDWGGAGLHGKQWNSRSVERLGKPEHDLDENMSFQGSAWFMRRDHFHELGLMDEERWGPFWSEAQEIGVRCWLSGGKVMTNKKTWYAHLHKGKAHGRGYTLPEEWLRKGRDQAMRYFAGEKVFSGQKEPLSWLINRFWPVPTWTPDGLAELRAREAAHWTA